MWSYGVFGRTIGVNYASELKDAIKSKHKILMKDVESLNALLKRFDGEVVIVEASGNEGFNESNTITKIYVTYSYYTKTSDNIKSLIADVSQKLKMNPIIVKDRKDLFPNIIGGQKKIMKKLYDEFNFSKYSRIFQEEIIYVNESFKDFLYAYALTNNWI